MENTKHTDLSKKILSVLLGALTGGFIFRCRGESGFGSSWGLFSVGLVLTLLLWHFYGNRSKMKFERILIGALMMGFGVTGYGTVITQMNGMLFSDLPFNGSTPVYLPISPYSGMVIDLLMGFTLVPLFAFFVGTLFSKKDYKLCHYAIAVALYYVVSNLMKLTVSPCIMQLINPEQVAYAAKGLAYAGIDMTPWKAYLTHFLQRSWSQDIPFNENYYMSIEHISDSIAAIAVFLYPRIAFKDKTTGRTAFLISLFTSVFSTALMLHLTVLFDTGFLGSVKVPRPLELGAGWGIWEYGTGFFIGLLTMLVAVFASRSASEETEGAEQSMIQNPKLRFAFNWVAATFVLGVVPIRALCLRINGLFCTLFLLKDDKTAGTNATVVLSVMAALAVLINVKRNLSSPQGTAIRTTSHRFACTAFPAYMTFCLPVYFLLDRAELIFFPYKELTGFAAAWNLLTGPMYIVSTIMILTWIAFAVLYFPYRKSLLKAEKE